MNRVSYKATIKIISDSVSRIDPNGVLAGGASMDEFDSEITSILELLRSCTSGEDVALALEKVLNESFGDNFKETSFEDEGNTIYKALQDQNLNP